MRGVRAPTAPTPTPSTPRGCPLRGARPSRPPSPPRRCPRAPSRAPAQPVARSSRRRPVVGQPSASRVILRWVSRRGIPPSHTTPIILRLRSSRRISARRRPRCSDSLRGIPSCPSGVTTLVPGSPPLAAGRYSFARDRAGADRRADPRCSPRSPTTLTRGQRLHPPVRPPGARGLFVAGGLRAAPPTRPALQPPDVPTARGK